MVPTSADLYFAITNGCDNDFEEMLRKKMPLDTVFFQGITLVSYALYKRQNYILSCLVKANANVNIRTRDDKMEPPLFTACRMNNLAGLQILLTSPNLDINQRDFFNRTALWASVKYHTYCATQLLLEHGAAVNIAQCDAECPLLLALSCAFQARRQKFSHLLIRHGGILVSDTSRDFALRCMFTTGDRETFRLLILSGFTVTDRKQLDYHSLPISWQADVELCQWIKSIQEAPLPLTHLAKNVIRLTIATSRKNIQLRDVNQLQIPHVLKKIIMLEDLL
ncbi:uncharacterized protein LOC129220685 [Uloborus diversus]|uniref:uncharacterized protein LOC129220685 n=1 Tax=Uloborus diversus TaxID=327109 RepID=UPI0024098DA3|nr:uncharacterized protein LOC129220685 [Uloborus diversus]